MPETPNAPLSLAAAPGARAAKLCGIWSIVASLTCVGLPVGIVLAIIAVVQQAKAKRLAKENPDLYETPTNVGLVTGIIGLAMPVLMLPFLGIAAAIAIPLVQGRHVRDDAQHMSQTMTLQMNVMEDYQRMLENADPVLKRQPDEVIQALIAMEQARSPRPQNAYDGSFPFERAPRPTKPGAIALWAEQDPDLGPVVQVRWMMWLHDQDKEESIPLPLR